MRCDMKILNPKTAIICSVLLTLSIIVITVMTITNKLDASRSEPDMPNSSSSDFEQVSFPEPPPLMREVPSEPFSFEIKREFSSRTEIEEEMQRLNDATRNFVHYYELDEEMYIESKNIAGELHAELEEIAKTIPFTEEERHKKKVELFEYIVWENSDNIFLFFKAHGVKYNEQDMLDFEQNYKDRIKKDEYYENGVNLFEEMLMYRNTIRQAKADYEAGEITVDEALRRADRHVDFYESRGQEVPEFLR